MSVIEESECIIIGAGPAGLFSAIHAAAAGSCVTVLEKNPRPGAKLLLAGSGQCNLTHNGEIFHFFTHYGSHGKFVKPALMSFTNKDLQAFFRDRGLPMITGDNGKVFPETRQSGDVLEILLAECRKRGVTLRCSEPVSTVVKDGDTFRCTTPQGTYRAAAVIITTGGASYPKCGTTGDGYRLAAGLGQPVTETGPALTPLLIRPFPFSSLMGISFEGMHYTHWRDGKKLGDHTGDVLFTHLGLSGPGIFDASRNIRPGDEIRLSFAGGLRREEFALDLAKRAAENPGWQVSTILAKYPIPERLNRKLLRISGIEENLTCAHFSSALRSALVKNCCEFPLTIAALGDYPVAMVTRGGVALESVNAKTMESKMIPGLFFAGEVLDVDGDCGGYNLQAAFSTGFLAGTAVRKRLARG
jgi:predicted Rossmann fold flavoprotein